MEGRFNFLIATDLIRAFLNVSKEDGFCRILVCGSTSPESGEMVRKVQVWIAAAVSRSAAVMLPILR